MYKSKFYFILILFSLTFLNTKDNKTKNWYFLEGSGMTENWYFLGGSGMSSISEIKSDDLGLVNGTSYDIGFYWHYNQNTLYGLGMIGKSESLNIEEQNLRKQFNLIIPSLNLIHFKNNFGSGIFFRLGIGPADVGFKEMINDEEIIDYIRSKAETAYHPSCTLKMGVDDMAVVDQQLRIHGLKNIRVADALSLIHI